MLIKKPSDIKPSEITDQSVYLNRRHFIKAIGRSALTTAAGLSLPPLLLYAMSDEAQAGLTLQNIAKRKFVTDEPLTPLKDISGYNNFYEFSTEKQEPALLARNFKTSPWTVKVDGEINKPADYHLEDLIKPYQLEERIYRHRCVETWSMVIPWVGIPLRELIKRFEPTSKAKYIEFTTLYDPEQMPGQRWRSLDWPYVEGLRMDEAMNELAMLAVGLYGDVLPNQNGAPIRLVVPWKYGFKNIKSIVRIRFTEQQPVSSWMRANSREYGFYANVNPKVDHPRWSQAKERRIGDFFKRDTLMFNGYAEQVASLYTGMDLAKQF